MRIIGGEASGVSLSAPSGWTTRPTGDRVREALFNTVAPWVGDARVLDLYAGTGALGLEALSRGAHAVVWVERDPKVAQVIRSNWERSRLSLERGRLLVMDAAKACRRLVEETAAFDLVFCDPPWQIGVSPQVVGSLDKLLAAEGRLVIEAERGHPVPEVPGWERFSEREYGRTMLHYFRRNEASHHATAGPGSVSGIF